MATQVVEIQRGEPVQFNFTVTPLTNITGWTIVFSLAQKRETLAKLVQTGVTVLDPIAGTFRITLSSTQTNIVPSTYWWDVWRTDAGSERLLAIGYLTIAPVVRLPAAP